MHLFTYGSLMFPPVWERVVAGRPAAVPASVEGFRRRAVRGETYPGVVREAGARVSGRLYLDVDAADLARLDAFEGADYQRVVAPVRLDDGSGRVLDAGLYLYLPTERLEARDWDAEGFGRDALPRFLALYGGFGGDPR